MYGEVATREVAVAPLHASVAEPISCLQFSAGLEVIWAGSATGGLYTLQCQAALQRYACVQAHEGRVHDMCAVGDGVLSLSSDRWRHHAAGGMCKLTYMDPSVTDLAACEFEPGSASRVMLGREGGGMIVYDLDAQQVSAKAEVEGGVLVMRAPAGRGLVAIGNAAGQLVLADPRAGYKVEHTVTAHSGGLEALDARGNFLATCGYGMRLGQVALDNTVKVFDLRSAPRLLNTVPFRPGPSLLRFHPKFSSTLLIGSEAGIFTLSDIQGTAPGPTYQIDTEGDAVTSCAFSSSGEMMAFGGSGGFTHLWATSATPRVNMASHPLEFPNPPSKPPRLNEQDSFALPFPYGLTQSKLLSDFSFPAPMHMRQPPRIVPASLLKEVRQVEFVGYVANPKFRRGAPPGEATKAVAAMRNMRQQPKQATPSPLTLRARTGPDSERGSPRQKGPKGSTWLPSRYRLQRVHVHRQAGLRWADEFDFSFYNRTRFAGLENGVANCYVNSLVQVLFFIPAVRRAMLSITPDPDKEFSLSCEMSLLFRMLYTARGSVCQASNLFRALRQNKEAAALGLLESHAQQGPRDKDIEVETQKDQSLRRRIQSLQCFLFEQLHRELTHTPPPSQDPPGPPKGTLPPSMDPGIDNSASMAGTAQQSAAAKAEDKQSSTQDGSKQLPGSDASLDDLPLEGSTNSQRQASSEAQTGMIPSSQPTLQQSSVAEGTTEQQQGAEGSLKQEEKGREATSSQQPGAEGVSGQQQGAEGASGQQLEAEGNSQQEEDGGKASSSSQHPNDPVASSRSTVIDATFGIGVRQRTKIASGSQPDKFREHKSFQVELHYPPAKDRPPLPTHTTPDGAQSEPVPGPKGKRPCFCHVLARSLKPQAELRAWFNEQLGYQPVQQIRIPLNMPNVLAVTCGLSDGADLAWWQPWRSQAGQRPWLPWAIAVQVHVNEWKVEVQESESPQDLLKQQEASPAAPNNARAVYELTAVVAHVVEAAEGHPDGTPPEGHLVAHVKVLPQDIDSQYGIAHSPVGPSPSQSPLARPFGSGLSGPPSAYSSALARSTSTSKNSSLSASGTALSGSAGSSGNPSRLSRSASGERAAAESNVQSRSGDRQRQANDGQNATETAQAGLNKEGQHEASGGAGLTALTEEQDDHSEGTASETVSLLDTASLPSQTDTNPDDEPSTSRPAESVRPPPPQGDTRNQSSHTSGLLPSSQQLSVQSEAPLAQTNEPPDTTAGADAAAQAAAASVAAVTDNQQLKQSRDAVLSGEDQAMKESLAAANAAGGERVRDDASTSAAVHQQQQSATASSPRNATSHAGADTASASASPAQQSPPPATATASAAEHPGHEHPLTSATAEGSQAEPDAQQAKQAGTVPQVDQDAPMAERYRNLSLVAPPPSASTLSSASSRQLSDGVPPSPSQASPAYRRPDWLLFNDFCITPCAPAEVLTLFGNQKIPCLLYYSRVDRALTPAEASVPPAPPSAVLNPQSFQSLCSGPPIQAPGVKRHPLSFEPLRPEELTGPGLLLGIDAEFVAHWPAEKAMQGGLEVEVCKARLGLARVSVVRGEGPDAGSPVIDDYIRSLEPITDYLTKWSGLVPGDLDPKASPHYLTTMKKAYLKLRYLVDSGCIFVGHDLRHDFKSINIIVPPQQVIDTVFLFHFKRQRKLSLRFLASYLLGEDIQQKTHDSIEDARTAVKLYQKYKSLVSEGRFQQTLLEMYRWGKQHGWDPAALRPAAGAASHQTP